MHLKTSASRKQTDKEKAYQNQFGQNFHIQKKKNVKDYWKLKKRTVICERLRKVNINPCQLVKLVYRCKKENNTNSLSL